jgi:quercetin dioxygenase-like cupin family protein
MSFCDLEPRAAKRLFEGVQTRTFWGERMLVSLLEFAPNSHVPDHTHPHEQVGIVVEGELYMTIAGVTRLMKAGESYVIPGNVPHSGRTGNKWAKVFDAFSPVRAEYQY